VVPRGVAAQKPGPGGGAEGLPRAISQTLRSLISFCDQPSNVKNFTDFSLVTGGLAKNVTVGVTLHWYNMGDQW